MQNNRMLALYLNLEDHKYIEEALNDSVICVSNVIDAVKLLLSEEYQIVFVDCSIAENEITGVLTTLSNITTIPIVVVDKILYKGKDSVRTISNTGYTNRKSEDRCSHCIYNSTQDSRENILSFSNALIIDLKRRQVLLDGKEVELTKIEFEILVFLAGHKRQVMSRDQIYNNVWTYNTSYDIDEIVKSHIKRLRKKLDGTCHNYIENVRGVGYRFVPPK